MLTYGYPDKKLPAFLVYTEFCRQHCQSLQIIRELHGSRGWTTFERDCSTDSSVQRNAVAYAPTPLGRSLSSPSLTSLSHTQHPLLSIVIPDTSSVAPSKLRFQDYAIKPIQVSRVLVLVESSHTD